METIDLSEVPVKRKLLTVAQQIIHLKAQGTDEAVPPGCNLPIRSPDPWISLLPSDKRSHLVLADRHYVGLTLEK